MSTTRPPITWRNFHTEIRWFNLSVVALTPLIALYGFLTTRLHTYTLAFSAFLWAYNMLGITAGYHRLWSHRSYKASLPLQYFLAIAGAGSVQGAIRWWAHGHRAHHRYTDTELDPYSAPRGFWWTHVGWMCVKPRTPPGRADVRDLSRDPVVAWQRKYYFPLAFFGAVVLPVVVCGFGWGDWRGGVYIAGMGRVVFVHHSTFSVNSLAHWLGSAPYDDRHTPRDHLITALLTLGEGYHNFHHQFPSDYRNAIKWWQYDPTKWFIALCEWIGMARGLQRFDERVIKWGEFGMKVKKLRKIQEELVKAFGGSVEGEKETAHSGYPVGSEELEIMSWETFKEESRTRPLILVAGFIHDVSPLLSDNVDNNENKTAHPHPGGRELIERAIGTDATTAFFGGVYMHSNAAHNLLSTMRIAALHGGLEHVDPARAVAPVQRLVVTDSVDEALRVAREGRHGAHWDRESERDSEREWKWDGDKESEEEKDERSKTE